MAREANASRSPWIGGRHRFTVGTPVKIPKHDDKGRTQLRNEAAASARASAGSDPVERPRPAAPKEEQEMILADEDAMTRDTKAKQKRRAVVARDRFTVDKDAPDRRREVRWDLLPEDDELDDAGAEAGAALGRHELARRQRLDQLAGPKGEEGDPIFGGSLDASRAPHRTKARPTRRPPIPVAAPKDARLSAAEAAVLRLALATRTTAADVRTARTAPDEGDEVTELSPAWTDTPGAQTVPDAPAVVGRPTGVISGTQSMLPEEGGPTARLNLISEPPPDLEAPADSADPPDEE